MGRSDETPDVSLTSDEPVIALTMTPAAAKRFWKALVYAEGLVLQHAEAPHGEDIQRVEDHGEWLRWGFNRLGHALYQIGEELL